MSSARDIFALILLLAAAALGAIWLPATWLDDNVVEREGFLAITEPLADDPAFQRTFSDSAVDTILGDEKVPAWIEDQLTPLAQEQAENLTGTDTYATMWKSTMSELHHALFTPGVSDLDVDLEPAIDRILTPVEKRLPIEIPRPQDTSVTLASVPDVPLLTGTAAMAPWASWAGPVALVLLAAALAIAAHRRTMLVLAGLGGILAGAGVWWLGAEVEMLVPDSVDQAAFLGPIVQVFQAHFQAAMVPQGVILLGAGALVMSAGLVLVGLHRRS